MKEMVLCKVAITALSIGGKYPEFEATKEKKFGDLIVKEPKVYTKGDTLVLPKKFAKSLGSDIEILGPVKEQEIKKEAVPETKKVEKETPSEEKTVSEEETSSEEGPSSSENFSYPISLREKIRRFFLNAFR